MKRINDIQAWMGAAALCLSSCPLSAQQVVPTGEPVLSWQDSTQLKVAFSVAAGDVEITSDDRLILTPRLTTKAGDTLTLPLFRPSRGLAWRRACRCGCCCRHLIL